VALLATTALSFGAMITLDTSLTPVAGTNSTGAGTFQGTFDDSTGTLVFTLNWMDLTSELVNAHIHLASVPGGNGGVLVPFLDDGGVEIITPPPPVPPLGTAGTLTETINITDAATLASFEQGLAGGLLYVNVHSTNFPVGEIRGDFAAIPSVPEPTTFLLLGGGMLAIALLRRRR